MIAIVMFIMFGVVLGAQGNETRNEVDVKRISKVGSKHKPTDNLVKVLKTFNKTLSRKMRAVSSSKFMELSANNSYFVLLAA